MSLVLSILGFFIILGPLVVVHEFGHFFFAKFFNVKAEAFSVGFGKVLFKKQVGETEFRVSTIPMGGYVKLLGEDREAELSPEDQKRALHKQAPHKRFFIFFGGPLFNFLFAILVFMVILVVGEPQVASVVGRVIPDSPAAKAGFQSGDRIVSVEGKPVRKFEDVLQVVSERPGKPVSMQVLHRGANAPSSLSIVPEAEEGFTVYGETSKVGEIDGILASPRAAVVAVTDPASFAAKTGLKTGDLITEMNGTPISSWEQLEENYAKIAPGSEVSFKYQRKNETLPLKLTKPAGDLAAVGFNPTEFLVGDVVKGSPAEKAGLKPGDRIFEARGKPLKSFGEFRDLVQKSGETATALPIAWERDGKRVESQILPQGADTRDPLLRKTRNFTIGIMAGAVYAEPEMVIERVLNPITLVATATERMVTLSWRNLVSIVKMVTGDVSVATLGGPIMIGKIAGESLSRGLVAFLTTMALLSVGLGVLNILPIPVLDGGHLMLLAIETVRGKPLSLRQMEIVQQVGLTLILLLMVIVLKNDVLRLF